MHFWEMLVSHSKYEMSITMKYISGRFLWYWEYFEYTCQERVKKKSVLFCVYMFNVISSQFQNHEDLHFYVVPVVLIGMFSFLIAHCMLSVYEVSGDKRLSIIEHRECWLMIHNESFTEWSACYFLLSYLVKGLSYDSLGT